MHSTDVCLTVVHCILCMWLGWSGIYSFSLQHRYHSNPTVPKLQHTSNQEQYGQCGNSIECRKLLMMDILMSETCWAHKKWNKIASDIKLVFYSTNKQKLVTWNLLICTVKEWFLIYYVNMTQQRSVILSFWRQNYFFLF